MAYKPSLFSSGGTDYIATQPSLFPTGDLAILGTSSWVRKGRTYIPRTSGHATGFPKLQFAYFFPVISGGAWLALSQGSPTATPSVNGIGAAGTSALSTTWNSGSCLCLIEFSAGFTDSINQVDSVTIDWEATTATTGRGKTINISWNTTPTYDDALPVGLWMTNSGGTGNIEVMAYNFIGKDAPTAGE